MLPAVFTKLHRMQWLIHRQLSYLCRKLTVYKTNILWRVSTLQSTKEDEDSKDRTCRLACTNLTFSLTKLKLIVSMDDLTPAVRGLVLQAQSWRLWRKKGRMVVHSKLFRESRIQSSRLLEMLRWRGEGVSDENAEPWEIRITAIIVLFPFCR
jgi:hypothetical protein